MQVVALRCAASMEPAEWNKGYVCTLLARIGVRGVAREAENGRVEMGGSVGRVRFLTLSLSIPQLTIASSWYYGGGYLGLVVCCWWPMRRKEEEGFVVSVGHANQSFRSRGESSLLG